MNAFPKYKGPSLYVMTNADAGSRPAHFHAEVSCVRDAFASLKDEDPWAYHLMWWNPWTEEWHTQKLGTIKI